MQVKLALDSSTFGVTIHTYVEELWNEKRW